LAHDLQKEGGLAGLIELLEVLRKVLKEEHSCILVFGDLSQSHRFE